MRLNVRYLILGCLLLTAAACSPSGETERAGADAITPRNPFFGTWELVVRPPYGWVEGQTVFTRSIPTLFRVGLVSLIVNNKRYVLLGIFHGEE